VVIIIITRVRWERGRNSYNEWEAGECGGNAVYYLLMFFNSLFICISFRSFGVDTVVLRGVDNFAVFKCVKLTNFLGKETLLLVFHNLDKLFVSMSKQSIVRCKFYSMSLYIFLPHELHSRS